MAKVIPFKAVRPSRNKVHLICSRPFYTYKKSHLKAKLESNPYSFLHVINPEFNQPKPTHPNSPGRFKKVKNKYEEFKKNNYLFHTLQKIVTKLGQFKKLKCRELSRFLKLSQLRYYFL